MLGGNSAGIFQVLIQSQNSHFWFFLFFFRFNIRHLKIQAPLQSHRAQLGASYILFKSPKSMPELKIKCYGGIPPVVLSLKSCCLCYKNLSHTVTPVKRLSRTAATQRRAKTSTSTFSRSLILLQLNFLRIVSLRSILAWADLVLGEVQIALSGQDLRKKDSLLYLCFCHHRCAQSGRLWWIKNHCPMDVTLYYDERPLSASVEKHPCNWCG